LTFEIGLDCNGTCIRLVGCTFFKGNADEGSITVAQALKYYTTNLYGEKKKVLLLYHCETPTLIATIDNKDSK